MIARKSIGISVISITYLGEQFKSVIQIFYYKYVPISFFDRLPLLDS